MTEFFNRIDPKETLIPFLNLLRSGRLAANARHYVPSESCSKCINIYLPTIIATITAI